MRQAADDEAKHALFVEMVRAALIVSYQSRKCTANSLRSLTGDIHALHEVCHRIPRRMSAKIAADDYVEAWSGFIAEMR